jgi:hypothetical protein
MVVNRRTLAVLLVCYLGVKETPRNACRLPLHRLGQMALRMLDA